MLPKKETKYSYNAFQVRDRRDKSECDSAVYSSLHEIQSCHLVLFRFLIPKCPKIPKCLCGNPSGTWSVQLFLPRPWRFLLGPCPRGPHPGDGAADVNTKNKLLTAIHDFLQPRVRRAPKTKEIAKLNPQRLKHKILRRVQCHEMLFVYYLMACDTRYHNNLSSSRCKSTVRQ